MNKKRKVAKKKWQTPKLLQHEVSLDFQEVYAGQAQCEPYGGCDTWAAAVCPA